MYRSKYTAKTSKTRHNDLETVESAIEKHLTKPKPAFESREIPYSIRNKHIYIVGKTRYGKSTLLNSIIQQDIENGAGVCVLDPKPSGQEPNLVESILQHIPPERRDDVIYFTAAKPIPIDAMTWETEDERQRLAGDLMKMFMSFLTQKEGDRWPNILRFVIHTLLEAKNCTFLDIHHFLADEEGARKQILLRVKNPILKRFWETFPKAYPKDAATPILNRMGQFVLVPPLSIVLGDPKAEFSLVDAIRDRKIILVDLTGAGEDTANLLGTLLVSKVQQAIGRNVQRTPFHFFADEFQNFQTSSFDKILSECGGLGLRLTLANQYVDQLDGRIRSSIFGNVSTFISFQIGDDDTRYFRSMMPPATPYQNLALLEPYSALFKIAGQQPVIKAIPAPPPPPTPEQLDHAERIKTRTLARYPCRFPIDSHTSGNGNTQPPTSSVTHPETRATEPLSHDAAQAPRRNLKKKNS